MQLLIINRSTNELVDTYRLLRGSLSYDYLETTNSEVTIETPITFNGMRGDWVILSDDNDNVIYMGFIKGFDVRGIETDLQVMNWQSALTAEVVTTKQIAGQIIINNTNFNYFVGMKTFEEVALGTVFTQMRFREELLIEIFKKDTYTTSTPMSLFTYWNEPPENEGSGTDIYKVLTNITRLDMLRRTYELSGVMVYPSKLVRESTGKYRVTVRAMNADKAAKSTTVSSTDDLYNKTPKPVVNLKTEYTLDLKVDNRTLDVMGSNVLMFNVDWKRWDVEKNDWAEDPAVVDFSAYYVYKTWDGRVTDDKSDPSVILPSIAKVVRLEGKADSKTHNRIFEGMTTASERLKRGASELLSQAGEYNISFKIPMDENFLIRNFQFTHGANHFDKKETPWDNLIMGTKWTLLNGEEVYEVGLTSYTLTFEESANLIELQFGDVRSSMKYLVNNITRPSQLRRK